MVTLGHGVRARVMSHCRPAVRVLIGVMVRDRVEVMIRVSVRIVVRARGRGRVMRRVGVGVGAMVCERVSIDIRPMLKMRD